MTIHLKPETQALMEQDVERGIYKSIDDYLDRAVRLLHEQERWLAENRSEIEAQIEHGFAQAQQGELIDSEAARHSLRERRLARRG